MTDATKTDSSLTKKQEFAPASNTYQSVNAAQTLFSEKYDSENTPPNDLLGNH